MRPFPGWIIQRVDDEIVVMAPAADPGMMHVHPKRGRLADRLLYALADALLLREADHVPGRPGREATRGILREVWEERARQDAKFGAERDHPSVDPRYAHSPVLLTVIHGIPSEYGAKRACDNAFREGHGSWAHIAIEELVEAICAVGEQDRRAELVQVAAVAVAWIEAIDRRAGMEASAPPAPQSPGQGGAAAYMADGHIELGCGSLPSLAILDERPAVPA